MRAIIRLNAIIFIKIVLKFENVIEIVLLRSYEINIFKKQPITFILNIQMLFKILYNPDKIIRKKRRRKKATKN